MSHTLYQTISLLEKKNIHFFLFRDNTDSISISATLPGKRIEIYINEEGEVDFSVFRGNEEIFMGVDALTAELDSA